jgi:hypothetical protein
MFIKEHKLWSFSLCSFLRSPVISSLIDTLKLLQDDHLL